MSWLIWVWDACSEKIWMLHLKKKEVTKLLEKGKAKEEYPQLGISCETVRRTSGVSGTMLAASGTEIRLLKPTVE